MRLQPPLTAKIRADNYPTRGESKEKEKRKLSNYRKADAWSLSIHCNVLQCILKDLCVFIRIIAVTRILI